MPTAARTTSGSTGSRRALADLRAVLVQPAAHEVAAAHLARMESTALEGLASSAAPVAPAAVPLLAGSFWTMPRRLAAAAVATVVGLFGLGGLGMAGAPARPGAGLRRDGHRTVGPRHATVRRRPRAFQGHRPVVHRSGGGRSGGRLDRRPRPERLVSRPSGEPPGSSARLPVSRLGTSWSPPVRWESVGDGSWSVGWESVGDGSWSVGWESVGDGSWSVGWESVGDGSWSVGWESVGDGSRVSRVGTRRPPLLVSRVGIRRPPLPGSRGTGRS